MIKTVLKNLGAGLFILSVLIVQVHAEIDIERHPVSYGMFMEVGQIAHGWEFQEKDIQFRGQVEQRTGIYIIQRATVADRLKLNIGVGGLFYFVPQDAGQKHQIGTKFGPGIAETNFEYHFGDPEKGNAWLKAGYWPVKYNQNAKNLGEYLFRSGTYPGFLVTGGWAVVNYAHYYGQGLQFHLSLLDGMLDQDLTLFMERDYFPNHDLTPSYLVNLNLGPFEIGGGVSLHHLIAMKPSLLKQKSPASTYLYFDNFPEAGIVQDDSGRTVLGPVAAGSSVEGLESALLKYETPDPVSGDTVTVVDQKWWVDELNIVPGNLRESQINNLERIWCHSGTGACIPEDSVPAGDPAWVKTMQKRYRETDEYVYPRREYVFSHRGVKLMFRAALDFRSLLKLEEQLNPEEGRIFAEAALLGVEDRPFYFENKAHRIPVMLGLNIPTFKILDLLSLQFEYYNSQFDNTTANYIDQSLPVWYLPGDVPWNAQLTTDEDNWNWSVYAKKTWLNTVSLYLQVANDHLRTFHPDESYRPFYATVLPTSKDWYYMLRLDVGI